MGKFLTSKFSGYIAIAGVVAILGLVWYIFNEGKKSCQNNIATEQVDNTIRVSKETNNVRQKEQSFTIDDIDRELCRLGIMRQNRDCE
jgi:hypothetical protein